VTQALVLAAAVALLGAMILFIGHSLRTMTASATRSVPLDLQGPVADYGKAQTLAAKISKRPEVAQASPVATAPFAGVSHRGAAGITAAGAGALLAVPPNYLEHIETFRFLRGGLHPGRIVLDQQLAATLRAGVGDTVSLRLGGGQKQTFTVGGVALVTAPDILFQPLNPLLGPAPAQPPANIAILPVGTFAHTLGGRLPTIGTASAGAAAVPGTVSGVQWQVQVQLDRAGFTGTPSEALKTAGQFRNSIERTYTGKIQFVDNLSEQLETAAGDALYAEALFIMLAVPGALLALGLAYLAALGTVDRDRRELALLRARGSSRRQLLAMAATESTIVGLFAGLLGAGISFLAVATLIEGSVGLNAARAIAVVLVSIALAIVGGLVARLGTGLRSLSETVSAAGRRSAERDRKPLWQRLYLDFLALALSGLVYWLTASTGFSAVVNPDSNPTLSLSIYMFFAPALLWIGATLLLVRLRGRAFGWFAARLARIRRVPDRRTFLFASASRRGAAINRGLVFVGLLLAFGVSMSVFAATYSQQAGVDAQLTLGADITATAPPGVTAREGLVKRIEGVKGVSAASAVDHSYAYVGPDLQDTFGIEPATLGSATTLRDSYFIGGSAQTMMSRLETTPDGILVSKETITDYSLKIGDLLRLRVLDHRTGKFHVVPFHVVGTVQEFPSAPRDSFMVANLSYLQKADQAGGPNVVFASSAESPATVAGRVTEATRGFGVTVKDIRQQSVQTASSITTVDLTGISHLEQAFAIILAAAAMWLFVNVVVNERRHEFATMAALGASLRDIGAFVRAETVAVLAAAVGLAAVLGWLMAQMLVAMLQHVFDPPPDHLAVPWGFLGLLGLGALGGAVLAGVIAANSLRRLRLGSILREQ
jgi:putative ABC transport system permease protein